MYYLGTDCRVYYFEWSGSAWVLHPINPLNGWANRLVRGAMDVSQVNAELFYRSQNGVVYRLYQNPAGQWPDVPKRLSGQKPSTADDNIPEQQSSKQIYVFVMCSTWER